MCTRIVLSELKHEASERRLEIVKYERGSPMSFCTLLGEFITFLCLLAKWTSKIAWTVQTFAYKVN